MPVIPLQEGRAQFVFCLAYATTADREAMFARLDERFAGIPADRIGPEPVGLGGTASWHPPT